MQYIKTLYTKIYIYYRYHTHTHTHIHNKIYVMLNFINVKDLINMKTSLSFVSALRANTVFFLSYWSLRQLDIILYILYILKQQIHRERKFLHICLISPSFNNIIHVHMKMEYLYGCTRFFFFRWVPLPYLSVYITHLTTCCNLPKITQYIILSV